MEKPDALSAAEVLATYQQAWTLTQRMLEQARKAEWDALVATEAERNLLVEKLRVGDKITEQAPAFLDSKASLIRNILAADEEIRNLSGDWIVELRGILDNLGVKKKKKKIQKAYNA